MGARVAWLALTGQIAAASAAHADPAVNDTAEEHLARGIAEYRAHEYSTAIQELMLANRAAPELPEPYRWIALTEVQTDDCRSALINIATFVSLVPPGDPRVPELNEARDQCQRTGILTVESTPDGAAISVDGAPAIGATPLSGLAIAVGPHTIAVDKPGFEGQSRRIDVRALTPAYAGFELAREHDRPLVQRWWFWAAIGTVTVGALVALTYHPNQGPPATGLPTVTCTNAGCSP